MHLDRRSTRDGGLVPPRQRLIRTGSFQHPKAANVLLALQVWSVGDEHPTIGIRPQRPRTGRRCQATDENNDPRGAHLFIERVDIAPHRFAFCGRVVAVRVVNSNQILRHWLSHGGLLTHWPRLHSIYTRGRTGNRPSSQEATPLPGPPAPGPRRRKPAN